MAMTTGDALATGARRQHPALLVVVISLGYFVDMFDLVLFTVERLPSLRELLGDAADPRVASLGRLLLDCQMGGMLLGGLVWGLLGDARGRVGVLFGSILLYSVANLANAFVQTVPQYAALRFVSGFGLAGEIGVGVTLVSEVLSPARRGLGTGVVAASGMLGAVSAGVVGQLVGSWRHSFLIGGAFGLGLLAMRLGVAESSLFRAPDSARRGSALALFRAGGRGGQYLRVVASMLPLWFVLGVLVTFAPEMMRALGARDFVPQTGWCVVAAYAGQSLGEMASAALSQRLRSRRRTILLFLGLTGVAGVLYATLAPRSATAFYAVLVLSGVGIGYYAVFLSTAAELFGTNVRATVTTTAPNVVRASIIPISVAITALEPHLGTVGATGVVGGAILALAAWCAWGLEETFGKELDFQEPLPPAR